MRCRDYQKKLSRSLDADEPLSPGLRGHLGRCESCRRHYDELVAMGDRLRHAAEPPEPLSPELRERILSAVRSSGPAGAKRRIVIRLAPVMAAAACLLLAVGFFAVLNPNCGGPDKDQVVRKLPEPPSPAETPEAPLTALAANVLIGRSLSRAEEFAASPVADEVHLLAEDTRAASRALLACLPLELVGGSNGEWLDTLLPVGADRPKSGAQPASQPDS